MDNLGSYPPPNFDCPPPNTIQLSRPQPPSSRSSFHASMWTWNESPTEPQPNWVYGGQAKSNYQPASVAASHSTNYGCQYSYGREWYHAGQQNWSNYRPAGNQGKKRQNKKDPDFMHFCDTCDRGFKNQEKYDEHVAQHVKCSVPDCSFVAHEKIVSIHWKNTHAPGMKRIKLDTAEEIAKWREERRKNYPTLQNIERKRKLMQEREKTGAVLETAQFGRMRGRGWRGRGRQRFHGQRPQGVHPSDPGAGAGRPPPLTQPGQNGDPLGALAKSDIESDKDDADADSMADGPIVVPKQMSAALGSLVANYGSMSESETDEGAQDSTIQRAKKLLQENQDLLDQNNGPVMDAKTSTQDRQASNGSCPWSASNTSNNKQRGQGRRGGRRGRRGYQDMPQKRRATLLEMLLAPDIRHERNVLLQCVRYVVRNDFFGLESKTQLQLGIERTQVAGSSDQEVGNGCRTLSDSLFGRKRCSVEGGTSTPEAAVKPETRKEENVDIGPANGTVKTTVDHCSTQNSLDRGPLVDQAGSGQLDDKAVLSSSDNQSDAASDQARCGLSCPGAACQPPADQGVVAMPLTNHLSTPKSNNALVDSILNTEQIVEDKEEPATTYHHHDSVAPCESKSTNNIYDDEIWELSH